MSLLLTDKTGKLISYFSDTVRLDVGTAMQERRPTEAEEAMISFTPQVGLARTYPISLDRNLNSQTLDKLVELCETIEIHQVALLVLAYSGNGSKKTDQPLSHARHELKLLAQIGDE